MKNLFIILILPLLLPFSLFAQVEPIWYGEYNDIRQMEDPTFIGDNDEQFVMAEVYVPEGETYYTNVYKMETLTGKKLDSIYFEYVVRELEYDKSKNILYVGGDSLVKVDVESFEVIKRYPLPPPPFEVGVGNVAVHRVVNIGLSPNGKYIIGEGISRETAISPLYRLYLFDTELEEFVFVGEPDEYIRRITDNENRYEFIYDPYDMYVYYIEDNNDDFRQDERRYYLCRLDLEKLKVEKYFNGLHNLIHLTKNNTGFHLLEIDYKNQIAYYIKYNFDNMEEKSEYFSTTFLPKIPSFFEISNSSLIFFYSFKVMGFNIFDKKSQQYIFLESENYLVNPLLSPKENYLISNNNNTIYIYDYKNLLTATSVTEERDQSSILFNNPVEEILHIKSAEIKINKIEILDINGKVQKNIEMKNTEKDINISELSTGIYFLRVFSSHNSNTYKFIKE